MTAPAMMQLPNSETSDQDLILIVAEGDIEALGMLFDRHEGALRRYLGRMGIAADHIDDLVQATFMEVVSASARFDAHYSARSWLFGIATILVRRYRRSMARVAARLAVLGKAEPVAAPSPSPAEVFEHDQIVLQLERAVERLSVRKREVFLLITCEGLSGEEAAQALRIPVKTVWTRLHYARRELLAALEGLL